MSWTPVFLVFLLSHAAGDVLLQTDWQAVTKVGGLGDPRARRALLRHVGTYTIAFVPALVWIATETTVGRALAVAALVAIPHALVDDGRLVRAWLLQVKHAGDPSTALHISVDQTFHALCLCGAALVAAA